MCRFSRRTRTDSPRLLQFRASHRAQQPRAKLTARWSAVLPSLSRRETSALRLLAPPISEPDTEETILSGADATRSAPSPAAMPQPLPHETELSCSGRIQASSSLNTAFLHRENVGGTHCSLFWVFSSRFLGLGLSGSGFIRHCRIPRCLHRCRASALRPSRVRSRPR